VKKDTGMKRELQRKMVMKNAEFILLMKKAEK